MEQDTDSSEPASCKEPTYTKPCPRGCKMDPRPAHAQPTNHALSTAGPCPLKATCTVSVASRLASARASCPHADSERGTWRETPDAGTGGQAAPSPPHFQAGPRWLACHVQHIHRALPRCNVAGGFFHIRKMHCPLSKPPGTAAGVARGKRAAAPARGCGRGNRRSCIGVTGCHGAP